MKRHAPDFLPITYVLPGRDYYDARYVGVETSVRSLTFAKLCFSVGPLQNGHCVLENYVVVRDVGRVVD
jgi:hypothetical protein